jgi:hypothetical protein
VRVELVYIPIGTDARFGLGYPLAAEQARVAAVTGPGVDFH